MYIKQMDDTYTLEITIDDIDKGVDKGVDKGDDKGVDKGVDKDLEVEIDPSDNKGEYIIKVNKKVCVCSEVKIYFDDIEVIESIREDVYLDEQFEISIKYKYMCIDYEITPIFKEMDDGIININKFIIKYKAIRFYEGFPFDNYLHTINEHKLSNEITIGEGAEKICVNVPDYAIEEFKKHGYTYFINVHELGDIDLVEVEKDNKSICISVYHKLHSHKCSFEHGVCEKKYDKQARKKITLFMNQKHNNMVTEVEQGGNLAVYDKNNDWGNLIAFFFGNVSCCSFINY